MITAVILTKNEEKNIEGCFKSVAWCDEILVIDDYSEDKTVEKCQMSNVKCQIYKRHLGNDFAAQRNFGLEKAQGDWVLFVDADERISSALAEEIEHTPGVCRRRNTTPGVEGLYLRRRDFFGGRWLGFGETASVKLLRLGRRQSGKWEGAVHEVWKIKGKTGLLKNPLLHFPHPTISQFISQINFYSSLRAQELFREVKPPTGLNLVQGLTSIISIIIFPLGKFIQNYILRLGFLDGPAGLVMAAMMSFHSFLVRSKLFLLWKSRIKRIAP